MNYHLEFYYDHNNPSSILDVFTGALDIPEVPVKIFKKVPVTLRLKFLQGNIENKMSRGTSVGIKKVIFSALTVKNSFL